jgi:tetratricopeptide (TPR) repeat protein
LLVVGVIGIFNPLNSHIRLATQAFAAENYTQALQEYELALQDSPENWDIKAKMAEVYLAQKNFSKAQLTLSALRQKDEEKGKLILPLLAKADIGVAELAREREPYGSKVALMTLEKVLTYAPDNAMAKSLLAEEYYWESIRNSARNYGNPQSPGQQDEKLLQAIALDPKPMYKVELAKYQLDRNKPEEFAKIVNTFTKSDLSDPNANNALALLYLNFATRSIIFGPNNSVRIAESRAEALKILDQGLKVLPDNVLLLREKMRRLAEGKDFTSGRELGNSPGLSAVEKEILSKFWFSLEGQKFLKDKKEWQLTGYVSNPKVYQTDSGPLVGWIKINGNKSEIRTLDLTTGKQAKRGEAEGVITSLFITKQRQVVYSLATNGKGEDGLFWAAETGRSKLLYPVTGNMVPQKMSPDSRYVSVNGSGAREGMDIVELIRTANNGLEARLVSNIPNVLNVYWAPDSKKLLVQQRTSDAAIVTSKICDIQGKELLTLPTLNRFTYFVWAPDGTLTVNLSGVRRLDSNAIMLGELDEQTGQLKSLMDKNIYLATIGWNPFSNYQSGENGQAVTIFFNNRSLGWSPDGKYLYCEGESTPAQNSWVLVKGRPIPLPLNMPGEFIGWSGEKTAVFIERTWGAGNNSEKVSVIQYTLNLD